MPQSTSSVQNVRRNLEGKEIRSSILGTVDSKARSTLRSSKEGSTRARYVIKNVELLTISKSMSSTGIQRTRYRRHIFRAGSPYLVRPS